MSIEDQRMNILHQIDTGEIDVEEGMRRIKMLENSQAHPELTPLEILEKVEDGSLSVEDATSMFRDEQEQSATNGDDDESVPINHTQTKSANLSGEIKLNQLKQWWVALLAGGVFITVISGWWMYSAWQNHQIGFWFFCSWIPFLIGLGVLVLAWVSRSAPWLHVRVKQRPGSKPRNISLSLPIPTGLAAWFMRTFGRYIPYFDDSGIDELIVALEGTTSSDHPVIIDIDEGEDGEEVQVIIG